MLVIDRWMILILGIASSLLLLIAVPEKYLIFRTLSITAIAVISICYYLYCRYHKKLTIQADLLIAFNTLIQFLLPVFYLVFYFSAHPEMDYNNYRFNYPVTSFAALLGQTLFFAGYETIKKSLYFPKIKITQNLQTFFVLFSPLLIMVWIARIILLFTGTYYNLYRSEFQFSSPYYSLLAQLDLFGMIIIAALFLIAYSDDVWKSKLIKMILAIAFLIPEIIWYLPSGRREPIAILAIIPIIAFMFIHKRIPVKTILIIMILGFLSFTTLGFVRYVIPKYINSQESISITTLPNIISDSIKLVRSQNTNVLAEVLDRLYDGKSLGYLIAHYARDYNYELGSTYKSIVYAFVPRFIYHDKPIFTIVLGRWYKLILGGAQPVTFWGESYINFSWAGIIFCSFILGLLMKAYDFVFIKYAKKSIWTYFYVLSALFIMRLPVEAAVIWISYLLKFIFLATTFTIIGKLFTMPMKERDSLKNRNL